MKIKEFERCLLLSPTDPTIIIWHCVPLSDGVGPHDYRICEMFPKDLVTKYNELGYNFSSGSWFEDSDKTFIYPSDFSMSCEGWSEEFLPWEFWDRLKELIEVPIEDVPLLMRDNPETASNRFRAGSHIVRKRLELLK